MALSPISSSTIASTVDLMSSSLVGSLSTIFCFLFVFSGLWTTMAVVNSVDCELGFVEIGIGDSWIDARWIGFKGWRIACLNMWVTVKDVVVHNMFDELLERRHWTRIFGVFWYGACLVDQDDFMFFFSFSLFDIFFSYYFLCKRVQQLLKHSSMV